MISKKTISKNYRIPRQLLMIPTVALNRTQRSIQSKQPNDKRPGLGLTNSSNKLFLIFPIGGNKFNLWHPFSDRVRLNKTSINVPGFYSWEVLSDTFPLSTWIKLPHNNLNKIQGISIKFQFGRVRKGHENQKTFLNSSVLWPFAGYEYKSYINHIASEIIRFRSKIESLSFSAGETKNKSEINK